MVVIERFDPLYVFSSFLTYSFLTGKPLHSADQRVYENSPGSVVGSVLDCNHIDYSTSDFAAVAIGNHDGCRAGPVKKSAGGSDHHRHEAG